MRLPDYALSPLTYVLLLAFLLALSWRRLPQWLRVAGVIIEMALLSLMAPVGANVLVRIAEVRGSVANTCAAPLPTTIVLLDGGTDRRPHGPDDFAALSDSSLRRLLAAVDLWRRTPNARLVISGGGSGVPHSILLRGLAERMDVPGHAIEIEDKSLTTWENALYTSRLSPVVPRHVWLVTSALHMPRALAAFRAWGFDACAWPSGSMYVPFGFNLGYFVPQSSALEKADAAIHELVGRVVYRGIEWKHRREARPPSSEGGEPSSSATTATLPDNS